MSYTSNYSSASRNGEVKDYKTNSYNLDDVMVNYIANPKVGEVNYLSSEQQLKPGVRLLLNGKRSSVRKSESSTIKSC